MSAAKDWLEVGDRVFTRRYRFYDQQIGVVLGEDAALVVDTRTTPGHARELIADIGRLTPLPVTVVIDTHWHSDHVFGNHTFRPAVIWGHERCRTRLLETGAEQLAHIRARMPEFAEDLADMVIDPPERTFSETAEVEVGGRRLELRHLGRGHTDADIVILVPDADVLFAGDLLENDAVAYFGDGYPMDWPATAERILGLVTGAVVPGHGSIGDREFVERQLGEFRAVAEAARRHHAGEIGREEAVASIPYPTAAALEPLDRALAQLRGELD